MFVLDSTAYVVAGQSATNMGPIYLSDAWAYDAVANAWTTVALLPGGGRIGPYAFAVGGKGYVGGGAEFTGANPMQRTDGWSFDPATGQWTSSPAPPVSTLTLSASFALGNRGYVAGGIDAPTFTTGTPTISQQVWRFDPVLPRWTRLTDLPGRRAYPGCFTAGGYAYVLEGMNGFSPVTGFIPTHDLLRYDPAADIWTPLPALPGAVGRIVPFGFAVGPTAYAGGGLETSSNGQGLTDLWALPNIVTGTPTLAAVPAFSLAPNPARATVRLSGALAGPLLVLDGLGRTVRTVTLSADQPGTLLDLTGLAPGLYSVRCNGQARRLVVE